MLLRDKLLIICGSMAAVVSAVAGCSVTAEGPEAPPEQSVSRIAATASFSETRVTIGDFDGEKFPAAWGDGDALAVVHTARAYGDADEKPRFDLTEGAGTKSAKFEGDIEVTDARYFAVYPHSALVHTDPEAAELGIIIPKEQKPAAASHIDPAALILVSEGATLDGGTLKFRFNHAAAYAKMTLKNLKEDAISNIVFSSQSCDLAGLCRYGYDEGSISAEISPTYRSITVDAANLAFNDDGTFDVWFAALPADMNSFKVTVNYVGAETMERNCSSDTQTLSLKRGIVTVFSVDMSKPDVEPVFESSVSNVEIGEDGERFSVTVTTNTGCSIAQIPEWITLMSEKYVDDTHIEYVFYVESNLWADPRMNVIVFCNDNGDMIPVIVDQEGFKEAELDWTKQDFFHRSLFLRFTATWCSNCPNMGKVVEAAYKRIPDKLEVVAVHNAGSTLASPQAGTLENQYKIGGWPHGNVDGRVDIGNNEANYGALLISNAVKETETNYPTVTGATFSSYFTPASSGTTVNVEGKICVKKAGTYKIVVLLLEDGIVAAQTGASSNYVHDNVLRLVLSKDVKGDEFKTSADNSEYAFSYSSAVNAKWNTANLRVLVYVMRPFGSMTRIQTADYGDCFVDNAASGAVGTTVPIVCVEDSKGGNESIKPGDDIEM